MKIEDLLDFNDSCDFVFMVVMSLFFFECNLDDFIIEDFFF